MGLNTSTRFRAIMALRRRLISSSLFPENMGPQMTSIHPTLPVMMSMNRSGWHRSGVQNNAFELVQRPGEKVVLRLHPHQRFRRREPLVFPLQLRSRAILVFRALHEDLRRAASLQVLRRAVPRRKAAGDHPRRRSLAPQPRDHAGAERKPRQRERQLRIPRSQPSERSPRVFDLALQMAVLSPAPPDAAEVEPEHHRPR